MNKHTAAPANVSALTLICDGVLRIILPGAQTLLDEGVALGKPFDEIFVVHIIDGDVHMFVSSDERRVFGKFPIYDGEYVCDFAICQGLWTSE
jgi:hypothetical protein